MAKMEMASSTLGRVWFNIKSAESYDLIKFKPKESEENYQCRLQLRLLNKNLITVKTDGLKTG